MKEEKRIENLARKLDELFFEFITFQKIVSEYTKKNDSAGLYEYLVERNYLW